MFELNTNLWLGTQGAFEAARELEVRALALPAGQQAGMGSDEAAPDYLLQKVGSVGVVNIRGPLVNADNWMTAFLGMSTYPAIRRAMVSAAKDPEVKSILLRVDSGGGAVSGVMDTAELIARIDEKVKPVFTFSDGTMASAALWLGASGRQVGISATTLAGSLGVLMTHVEYSKAMQKDGATATVLRAGEFKALANSVEPLTKAAKEQIESHLQETYKLFAEHIADRRGVAYAVADQKMGQGREFLGAQAVAVGLVDAVSTFDAVLSKLTAAKDVDKLKSVYDNGIHKNKNNRSAAMPQASLTEQQIAALASGAPAVPAAALSAEALAAEAARLEAEAAAAAAATAAAATAAAAAAAPAPAAEAGNPLLEFVQQQLKDSQAAVLAGAVELAELKAKNAAAEATHGPLLEIARASIGKMQVALGGSAPDLTTLDAVAVVTEHKRVAGLFVEKFKVGGVAAAAASASTPAAAAQAASESAARLQATRHNKKK